MKKLVLMMVFVLLISLVTGCQNDDAATIQSISESEEVHVWKIAHGSVEGDVIDMYSNKLAEELEKEFGGKVKLEVYPAKQLGDSTERLELLQNAGLEFTFLSAPYVGTIVPEVQVTGLNFVFSEDKSVNFNVLHDGEAVKELNKLLLEQGIVGLDWFNEDFSCWTSNKPIRNVEDMNGLKIRSMNSPLSLANLKTLGANPTPLAFAEVYSGLQLNMIEGQENPIAVIEKFKFYEVQDYVILSNHSNVSTIFGTNPKFWNSLTGEDQEKLTKIIRNVSEYAASIQDGLTQESLDKIIASGESEIIELTQAQREAFIEASAPTREKISEIAGEEAKRILGLLLEDVKKFDK